MRLATVVLCLLACTLFGQPSFEVASVKPAPCDQNGGRYQFLPPGRFQATNVPLRFLIQDIYQIRNYQLIAAPEWEAILADGRCARYHIEAVAESGKATTEPELREMVKALFAERFALKMHPARQEMDVYALSLAPGGLKTTPIADLGAKGGGIALIDYGWTQGRGTMASFISAIAREVDRPIVDQTGHTGGFEFRLTWTPNDALTRDPGCPASFATMQERLRMKPEAWDCPNLFKALEEQLGLQLVGKRAPVDVWVVDHVERPSEN